MTDESRSEHALFSEPADRAGRPPRRRRAWPVGVAIFVVLVVLLGIAAVIVDNALRATAEGVAARQIENRLPDGVTGKVHVTIGGGSVILQYLAGEFGHVEVTAPSLAVGGVAVPSRLTATGVPTDLSKPVKNITAHVKFDSKALDAFVKIPGAKPGITLGSGTLSFDGSRSLLGFTVAYRATVAPKAAGDSIELTPKSAKVTAGPAGFDLSPVVNAIIGEGPVPVCVAGYLPAGVRLTHIDVTPQAATLTVHAKDLVLSSSTLASKGSCS